MTMYFSYMEYAPTKKKRGWASLLRRFDRLVLSVLACLMWTQTVVAEETLASVISRLKVSTSSEFSYIESREIQLLSETWQGRGQMYLSPDNMVIEQRSPKHSIVMINSKRMRYVEPETRVQFFKKLSPAFALPGMGEFLQLLYGDQTPATLEEKFGVQFVLKDARWNMVLIPEKDDFLKQMQISGEVDGGADDLYIIFKDGDATRWKMQLLRQGDDAKSAMNEVLKLASSVGVTQGTENR